MTELAVALIFAVLALVAVTRILNESHRQAQVAWAVERDKLLERIQRPERVPVIPRQDFVVPEREPDEWNKVGSIDIDEKWLNGEDG